jgi:predicted nucleic acid-binding Zn ribbon protein
MRKAMTSIHARPPVNRLLRETNGERPARPGGPTDSLTLSTETDSQVSVYLDSERMVGRSRLDGMDAMAQRREARVAARPQERVSASVRPSGAAAHPDAPEGRTTAFAGPSCAWCGNALAGRKERFCSDRCRMRSIRAAQRQRRVTLINTISDAVSELRQELGGDD